MGDDFLVEDLPTEKRARLTCLQPRLDLGQRDAFIQACDSLLASSRTELIVDLSRINRIFSLFIGSLVDLKQRADAAQKHLVIRVTPEVRNILDRMDLGSTLDLQTAP